MRDAFRTIVGGRSGDRRPRGNSPHGIEILLKKASVDQEFAAVLLKSPKEAARLISLDLHDSEIAVLASTPESTLRTMIRNTKVRRHQLSAFKTMSAALMLAAILAAGATGCDCEDSGQQVLGTTAYDVPASAQVKMASLQNALQAYKDDHGSSYPTTSEWNSPVSPLKQYVNTNELYDPWNNPFHYEGIERDGKVVNYRLKSRGPDGLDSDDDIQCPIDPEEHSW
ncbi:MAG: type II secretion system protein GspG [Dehalococcoidia bacterium]|nr:type II secretion system protein GspG [Dehalococcoidia bacterium]